MIVIVLGTSGQQHIFVFDDDISVDDETGGRLFQDDVFIEDEEELFDEEE